MWYPPWTPRWGGLPLPGERHCWDALLEASQLELHLPGSAEDEVAPLRPSADGPSFYRRLGKTWVRPASVLRDPGARAWCTLRCSGHQEPARGPPLPVQGVGVSPGVERIFTLSSISLWQIHICKYIFKG